MTCHCSACTQRIAQDSVGFHGLFRGSPGGPPFTRRAGYSRASGSQLLSSPVCGTATGCRALIQDLKGFFFLE